MFTPAELTYFKAHNTPGEIHKYFEGVRHGIWLFAWWKLGRQYVGTSGKTFDEAIEEVNQDEKDILGK